MLSFGLILSFILLMNLDGGATPPGPATNPGPPHPSAVVKPAARARGLKTYGTLPLRFELNRGQTDPRVRHLARGHGYTLFLTPQETVLSLQGEKSKVKSQKSKGESQDAFAKPQTPNGELSPSSVLRMRFVGASPAPKVTGLDELPGKSNYFKGNDPGKRHTNVPNFSKVRYEDLYPGVDLVYYGNEGRLEYDFVVAPGADPRAIAFEIVGPELAPATGAPVNRRAALQVDANGDLVIAIEGGEIRFHKPLLYQEATENGPRTTDTLNPKSKIQNRKYLDGRYTLRVSNPKSKIQNPKWQVGFEIASYDPTKPLVIDPVLSFSTYLGGANGENGYGVGVDADGNAYVTGTTGSTDFPTVTPLQAASGGDVDVFVAKVNATGTALVYSTYLGGPGYDRGTAIAVDASGNAYITGLTASNNFPTTTGAFQTAFGGGTCGTAACSDAFVTKLDPAGSSLVYSTYLGGNASDVGQGIALDDSGNAYVTGSTLSVNFPTASPLQAAGRGSSDAFVTKIKPDGTGLVYSTYLGGSGGDFGQSIAVDSAGNAFVTGYTFSANFPTAIPLQNAKAGSADAFVTEIDPAGSALVYSTYLGGTGLDRAFALALDDSGDALIAGDTASADFPTTAGAFQTTIGGGTCGSAPCSDAFVAGLNPAGSLRLYSTFLGGTNNDSASAIAVNSSGEAFVTGFTHSDDFPIQNALQTVFGGGVCGSSPCSDAFLTVLDTTGSAQVYSTFLGGSETDFGQAIALDGSSNAFVTGSTASPNFPATLGAVQVARGGNSPTGDAFLVKVGTEDAPAVALSPQKLTFTDRATGFTSPAQTVILTNSGSAPLAISSMVTNGDFGQTNTCGASVAPGGTTCTISVTFKPTATGDRTGDVTITDDAAGTPHKIPLAGKGVTPTPAVTLVPTSVDFGNQTFGVTSAPQTVTLTNSGTAVLTITSIAVASDFAQTNTCPVSPATLAVAASCPISVTFKPTATGERTGSITITDNGSNATSGKHTVGLKGNGVAVFSLSATATSAIVTRGTDSTTFSVKAAGPADFTSSITLTCGNNGSATCAFNPASIKPGETSTLTVANLKQVNLASLSFTVTGTSGAQIASLALAVNFADFSLAGNPTFGTITSGDSMVFTLTLTPTNGFTGSASFTCAGLPLESTCTFSPTTVTLDGKTAATVQATIKTTTRTTGHSPPRPWSTWPWVAGLVILATLAKLAQRARRRVPALLALTAAVFLCALFFSSCNENFYRFRGTPPGTFTIALNATVGDTTHSSVVSLTVN